MTFLTHTFTTDFGTRTLAYEHLEGDGDTIVWLGGYRSDMDGTKAEALRAWAAAEGHAFLRFDYSGHGRSGGAFERCVLSQWIEDAAEMIRLSGAQRVLLVGSSMGGWIACRLAQLSGALGFEVASLCLIAPAPDFTRDLMWDHFDDAVRDEIATRGVYYRPSPYSEQGDPITQALIADGDTHLILKDRLVLGCPVHILHGDLDDAVPLTHVERFMSFLSEDPVSFTLVRGGDHRLSREEDIVRMIDAVRQLRALG